MNTRTLHRSPGRVSRAHRLGAVLVVGLMLTGCALTQHETDPVDLADFNTVADLQVGRIDVALRIEPDGNYRACLLLAGETSLVDGAPCLPAVSGHPGDQWAFARRVGADVAVVVVHGPDDTLVDDRFETSKAAAPHLVAVSGGLLEDYPAGRVCTVYEHDQQQAALSVVVDADPTASPGIAAPQTCDPTN